MLLWSVWNLHPWPACGLQNLCRQLWSIPQQLSEKNGLNVNLALLVAAWEHKQWGACDSDRHMYFCWCALRHRNGSQYSMCTSVKRGFYCWRCKNEAFWPSHLSALVRTPLSADTLAHAVPHLRRMANFYDRIFASSNSQIALRDKDRLPLRRKEETERERKRLARCAYVFVLRKTPWRKKGEHRGFTSQNSHLVCLFVFHSSVAKHQSLHHIPVWLSTPLIKHLPVIPLLHRPSLPLPLTDCRGRPHTNSSLKCPPEGPALYSWKVRSALQEKALQNE